MALEFSAAVWKLGNGVSRVDFYNPVSFTSSENQLSVKVRRHHLEIASKARTESTLAVENEDVPLGKTKKGSILE